MSRVPAVVNKKNSSASKHPAEPQARRRPRAAPAEAFLFKGFVRIWATTELPGLRLDAFL